MTRKIRVRKTPFARHPYTATAKGEPVYGWGNTPQEARDKLAEMLLKSQTWLSEARQAKRERAEAEA